MSKARLIITAVVVDGRTRREVARDYGVSRYWVQQLVKRWHAEGEEEIVRLRKELSRHGLDAGANTIRSHPARRTPRSLPSPGGPADPGPPEFTGIPAVSTIWRIQTRRGFVIAQGRRIRHDNHDLKNARRLLSIAQIEGPRTGSG